MDEATLVQFVDDVFDLVQQRFGVVERISLALTVPFDYFQRVKGNFPRPPKPLPDIAFEASNKDKGPVSVGMQFPGIPKRVLIEPNDANNPEESLRQLARDIFELSENTYEMQIETLQLVMRVSQTTLEERRAEFENSNSGTESDAVTPVNKPYYVGIIDRKQHWEIVFKHSPT